MQICEHIKQRSLRTQWGVIQFLLFHSLLGSSRFGKNPCLEAQLMTALACITAVKNCMSSNLKTVNLLFSCPNFICCNIIFFRLASQVWLCKTRPDTWLPKLRAGGQGPYLRSLHHLGRSSEAKNRKNPKTCKCDGPMDGRMDRPTNKASGKVA